MRRYISIWAILFIMVMVHVDWHFGRGHHHHLSLNWSYHWLTGLVTFFLLALFCARKWPENFVRATLLNGLAGLFAGQIIEPLLEVLGYRVPFAQVFSPERWYVFLQFAIAGLAGLVTGVLVIGARRGGKAAGA